MRQTVNRISGIDWDRVKPEHYDELAAIAMEGAQPRIIGTKDADGTVELREPIWERFGTREYRAIGGHIVSVTGAANALVSLEKSWSSHLALLDALSTKRSEIFAAQVRKEG